MKFSILRIVVANPDMDIEPYCGSHNYCGDNFCPLKSKEPVTCDAGIMNVCEMVYNPCGSGGEAYYM